MVFGVWVCFGWWCIVYWWWWCCHGGGVSVVGWWRCWVVCGRMVMFVEWCWVESGQMVVFAEWFLGRKWSDGGVEWERKRFPREREWEFFFFFGRDLVGFLWVIGSECDSPFCVCMWPFLSRKNKKNPLPFQFFGKNKGRKKYFFFNFGSEYLSQ